MLYPIWCILDILKFFSRNHLERIQITNRMLNDIVSRSFASYPFRILPGAVARVQIRYGKFALSIRNRDRCFAPHFRTWNLCRECCEHFYSLNLMRPFLSKSVCFELTEISINEGNIFSPYSTEHIATLGSISHLWDSKYLRICDCSENDPTSLSLILKSLVLRCRVLQLQDDRRRLSLLQHSDIYSLCAIDLMSHVPISRDEMLQLVQQKAHYPFSDTIFVFQCDNESIKSAMEVIRKKFLASRAHCRLRLIITSCSPKDISEFRFQNNRTNETLQLKHISKSQAKVDFNVDLVGEQALLLERCIE
ncbi:hypothetical protein DdX_16105 [Ditylenchus destructor]|uniref:F-box domain-containing protein n=1 Tax=Ditylenchus destructor TaxID=166010 RepID=A0AAD4QU83_9BILA|nr:hypothetical protein DdX_16105 [Ditylenchus destructor]